MKTIIYSCSFVPPEWIAAHGLSPRRIVPHSAGDGASDHVNMGLCPYARAVMNHAGADPDADAVVLTTLCDQMRRASEWIARDIEVPVFLLNLPSTWQTASAQKLYIDELERLGRFLVRLGGTSPSTNELARVMLEFDSERSRLRGDRGRLSALQYSRAIAQFNRTGRCETPSGAARRSSGGVPVALLGGPMVQDDFGLFDLIERSGGRIVLDATDTGERTLPAPFDRRRLCDEPLLALAEAYFGTIPHPAQRPNNPFYEWLALQIEQRGIRRIILRRYVWCDIWHAEVQRLRECTELPILDLDVSDHPDAGSRTRTRIQAFLEMPH